MAEIKFKAEWLEQIALLAKCGTADDVVSLCGAIEMAANGDEPEGLSLLVQLAFNPIASSIEADRQLSRVRSDARKGNKSETNADKASTNDNKDATNADKTATKANKASTKLNKTLQEKEEEREEEGEAERETEKEDIPHTPLEEKDKEKGEEGEEEKEEEREISRPAADEACVLALPAPQFVAEKDPKKMTDKALEEEFEAIWLFYPRKAGKSEALRHYKAARRKGVDYDTIENGVMRYADYAQGQDPQYIAMGSTWFNGHRWEDQYVRKKSELERLWEL